MITRKIRPFSTAKLARHVVLVPALNYCNYETSPTDTNEFFVMLLTRDANSALAYWEG
jgi:hypothetical protein